MEKACSSGFTLIEIMIVVAVVAILAVVAYPSYVEYVQRGRIAEATSTLSDMRIRQEQFFQDNRTYISADTTCGAFAGGLPETESFTYACRAPNANAFTATATGRRSLNGFSFAIDASGARTSVTPWTGSGVQPCWVTKRAEAC